MFFLFLSKYSFAKDCEIHEEILGHFSYDINLEGIILGNKEIKKIFIKNESNLKNSKKLFRKYKRKKILALVVAPFRTSSDLIMNIYTQTEKNKIEIRTDYKLRDNSLSVLNQKFYLGIYSDQCLLEFKNIPILKKLKKDIKN